MVGCPYCGEKIVPEARVCRHCNRNVLYSAVLTASLDEKNSHRFIKAWQIIDKKQIRHLPLSNYSQSKAELSKIPLTLAWDLNQVDAQEISTKFAEFHIEAKLQGGLPSTFSPQFEDETKTLNWSSIAYGTLAIFFLSISILIWINNQKGKSEENLALRKVIEEIQKKPPIDLLSISKPRHEPQAQANPEKSFGRTEMEHLLNASVFIRDKNSLGSGFLITSDGYILSNAHVTSGMTEPLVIMRDGRQFAAEKVKEDSKLDASLLKIPVGNADALKLGNANELYPGQPVITIGNPGGLSFTVTRGIVSYLGRIISGVPYIQTDAAINRGNSGGPMINEALEVVGINSMTSIGEQGISFSLPINLVCANNGIAAGINTTPTWCETLKLGVDAITPAVLQRENPNVNPKEKTSPDSGIYQSQVDSLRAELARAEKDLTEQETRLNARRTELQAQAAEHPDDLSKTGEIQKQYDEINRTLAEIPKKKAEAQLRYLKQCISILERQKADPDYSSLTAQIETQINTLMGQQKALEAALN